MSSIQLWGPIVSVAVILIAIVAAYLSNENSLLFKLFPSWPRPILFISNRCDGYHRHDRPRSYWAYDLIDPRHLVQSYFLPLWGLLLLHGFVFSYFAFGVSFVDHYIDYKVLESYSPGDEPPFWWWLTYFTNWSFVVLGLAALVAFINTARHIQVVGHAGSSRPPIGQGKIHDVQRNMAPPTAHTMQVVQKGPAGGRTDVNDAQHAGARSGPLPSSRVGYSDASPVMDVVHGQLVVPPTCSEQPVLAEKWGWWSVTHQITMEVAITAAFFLTVFYWLVLVFLLEYDVTTDVNTFMKHGANCLLALLEVVLTRIPFVSYHFLGVLLYGGAYCLFLWIYGGITDTWRYGLDWQSARAVGGYALLPFVILLFFIFWYWVALLREVVGKRLHRDKGAQVDRILQLSEGVSGVTQQDGVAVRHSGGQFNRVPGSTAVGEQNC